MSFGTNLQNLRKQNNLTQEQFAEKMLVSRQTVSKWESDSSYPETEKIIAICDMFECSMDMLLRGDCTQIQNSNADKYNKHMNFFTACIAFATFFILFGVAVLIFLSSRGINENFCAAIFLSAVTVSVAIYIVSGIKHGEFLAKNKQLIGNLDKEKAEKFNKIFPFLIAFATVLILIGVIWLVIFSSKVENDEVYVSVFMLDIAIAVSIYIVAGLQKSKYLLSEYNNKTIEEKEHDKKNDKVCTIIMLLATITFFVLGFCFSLWKICWISFPIGGILCAIVSIILEK